MKRTARSRNYHHFKHKMNNLSSKESLRLELIKQMTLDLMKKHEVKNYKFRFGYSRTAAGSCTHDTITIQLKHALKGNISKIRDTILHEIAHALLSIGVHHRIEWQNKARELGVTWTKNYHK